VLALKNAIPSTDANILILGTKATVKSGAYEKRLQILGYKNLSAIATSLLVPIVEEGLYEGEVLQSALHHYFGNLDETPDAIILGCTHFPLVATAIDTYFEGKSTLIHSGEAIVEYLEGHYDFTKRFEETQLKFFASENPEGLRRVAKEWLLLD
jgi:glutamate racemase